jgi:hypothetical protein
VPGCGPDDAADDVEQFADRGSRTAKPGDATRPFHRLVSDQA